MRLLVLLLPLLLSQLLFGAEVRAIVPTSGPALIGPYSPGISAGDYVYVSGQGAKGPDGSMPDSFAGQVRQTLENVKAIVEAAGLTMDHIVYTQVYLEDIRNFDQMNSVYAQYFQKAPPARATLGVAKLLGTPVEINAVAVRDIANKKPVVVPGYDPHEPVSPGILTHDRLYVSGMGGRALPTGPLPSVPGEEVDAPLDGVKAVVEAAGLGMGNMVFVNPYLTTQIPARVMNKLYASRFEFGNTPARATIEVSSLPEGAQIEYTGVAVRDLAQRHAIRPKNMPPSPTASPCVFAGDTLYCSAKSGFIPGPNGGVFAASTVDQVRQTMRNLLDNLEEAGMKFDQVVSTTIYLDDLSESAAFGKVYRKYFSAVLPAETTVQQIKPSDRKPDEEGHYPDLEQVSLIAVRRPANH